MVHLLGCGRGQWEVSEMVQVWSVAQLEGGFRHLHIPYPAVDVKVVICSD